MDELHSTSSELGKLWKHKKTGGIYSVVGDCQIEATNIPGVLYRSTEGGNLWCRPRYEFLDGRFVPIEIETTK